MENDKSSSKDNKAQTAVGAGRGKVLRKVAPSRNSSRKKETKKTVAKQVRFIKKAVRNCWKQHSTF